MLEKIDYTTWSASEKAELTRFEKKAYAEYKEIAQPLLDEKHQYGEKFIYPVRDKWIAEAKKIRDEKIAQAEAEFEKATEEAMEWQNNHPIFSELDKRSEEVSRLEFRKYLEKMEVKKSEIDKKASTRIMKESFIGLSNTEKVVW